MGLRSERLNLWEFMGIWGRWSWNGAEQGRAQRERDGEEEESCTRSTPGSSGIIDQRHRERERTVSTYTILLHHIHHLSYCRVYNATAYFIPI